MFNTPTFLEGLEFFIKYPHIILFLINSVFLYLSILILLDNIKNYNKDKRNVIIIINILRLIIFPLSLLLNTFLFCIGLI